MLRHWTKVLLALTSLRISGLTETGASPAGCSTGAPRARVAYVDGNDAQP